MKLLMALEIDEKHEVLFPNKYQEDVDILIGLGMPQIRYSAGH